MNEQFEKAKDWFDHVNRSYKIALAVIVVLSIGATVYWAYVRKNWDVQKMATDIYHRYTCVFSGLTKAVTSCAAESVPGDAAVATAPVPAA